MIEQLLGNIKRIRKQRGLSQDNMAFDLGVETSTYSKWENGKIQLTIQRLEIIAKLLKVKVSDIYPSLTQDETVIEGRFKIVKLDQNIEVYQAVKNQL